MNVKRSLALLSIILFSSFTALAQAGSRQLTVEEIFASPVFQWRSLSSPRWLEGGKKFSYLAVDTATRQRDLYVYDVEHGTRSLIMRSAQLISKSNEPPLRLATYQWSPDERYVLTTGTLPARRTKSGGNFGLFDTRTGSFRMLTDTTAEQAIIKISPDGSKVGFVRSNNLFVLDIKSGKETQLTSDGSDTIINGKFDWVYEEEFAVIDGWQWSPDSKRIAFWRLDQSRVPTFPLVHYSEQDPQPAVDLQRYPKAGDPNATVKIGVVTLATGKTSWLDLGKNQDIYIPRIQWTKNPGVLSIQRLNRGQDTLDLMLADVARGSIRTILTETDTAWIDVRDALTFLDDGRHFLWASNRDGFTHLYLYALDGSLVRQLTRGNWEVDKLVGVDERRGRVFFTAAEASPLERQLYSVGLDGTGFARISTQPGSHSCSLAPDGSVYLDTYSSVHAPTEVILCRANGKAIAPVVENSPDMLKEYALGMHRFFTFRTSDGVTLNGFMIRPVNFDSTKKYPVLMYVYGGPGSQTVQNSWGGRNYLWHQMLAEKGYIIVSVDNRGTGARGKAFMQQTHRRLGLREVGDQIEAAKYLGSLPYVDASRIGIWGWSGGGFMTCMAMTVGADWFKTGIAVASVTNWKFYDTIYTERYMDTPAHNPEGYRDTSPITYASKFKGHLLIVHGTTDDNVHWENTIVFVNELIHDNKQVQTMFYPDRTHGISSDNATRHLFTMMTAYILENL